MSDISQPSQPAVRLPSITDHLFDFLAFNMCNYLLPFIIIALIPFRFRITVEPVVFNLSFNIISNHLVALDVAPLGGIASLADATGEHFLAFGGGLAGREGVGFFVVERSISTSERVCLVVVFEETLNVYKEKVFKKEAF